MISPALSSRHTNTSSLAACTGFFIPNHTVPRAIIRCSGSIVHTPSTMLIKRLLPMFPTTKVILRLNFSSRLSPPYPIEKPTMVVTYMTRSQFEYLFISKHNIITVVTKTTPPAYLRIHLLDLPPSIHSRQVTASPSTPIEAYIPICVSLRFTNVGIVYTPIVFIVY